VRRSKSGESGEWVTERSPGTHRRRQDPSVPRAAIPARDQT